MRIKMVWKKVQMSILHGWNAQKLGKFQEFSLEMPRACSRASNARLLELTYLYYLSISSGAQGATPLINGIRSYRNQKTTILVNYKYPIYNVWFLACLLGQNYSSLTVVLASVVGHLLPPSGYSKIWKWVKVLLREFVGKKLGLWNLWFCILYNKWRDVKRNLPNPKYSGKFRWSYVSFYGHLFVNLS